MSKGAQLAVGASIIAALVGWFAFTNLEGGSTFQYYKNLDEFLATAANSPASNGKSLRVHGYVANESIERNLQDKQVRFRVQNEPPHASGAGSKTLVVVYQGLETPDLFQDGAEVVVEGTLDGAGRDPVFLADNVLAKCPSKFEANQEMGTAQTGSL
jgi:cytochrome c-type biogenesis protein CcmE